LPEIDAPRGGAARGAVPVIPAATAHGHTSTERLIIALKERIKDWQRARSLPPV
jgi:hypothetical protein